MLNWRAFARAYRSCNPRDGAGPYGVPARLQLGTSPARAVFSRPRPRPIRPLLRRGVAHGHPRRRRLLFLAGSHQDGPRFLTVVWAQGPRRRPRPAARLPRDRIYRTCGLDRVSIRRFLREHGPLAMGSGLQLHSRRRTVPRRRSRRQSPPAGLQARVRRGRRDRTRPGGRARARRLAFGGHDHTRPLSRAQARGGGQVLVPDERSYHRRRRRPAACGGDHLQHEYARMAAVRNRLRYLGVRRVLHNTVLAPLPYSAQTARFRLLSLCRCGRRRPFAYRVLKRVAEVSTYNDKLTKLANRGRYLLLLP